MEFSSCALERTVEAQKMMHGTDGAPMFLLKSGLCCHFHLNKTQIYGVLTPGMAVECMDRGRN